MYTPSVRRIAAIQGAATSAEMELRTTAPRKAPTAPVNPTAFTVRQSILPKRRCETPDTRVVPSSAM